MKQFMILILLTYAVQFAKAQNWLTTGNTGLSTSNFLGTIDNKALIFKTNNAERMRILSSGNIGIGITNPLQKLHVKGNINIDSGYALYMANHRILYVDSIKENIFIGNGSGSVNAIGSFNTANGYYALKSNTNGFNNTANGAFALTTNTSGGSNTANGTSSLYSNTTGGSNTATGTSALYKNTTGNSNAAFGANALALNTTGYSNVAVGVDALYKNTIKYNLVAIGDSALYNNGFGTTNTGAAIENTAIGSKALYSNITGTSNTATGYQSLYLNNIGFENTAIGSKALYSNTTGTSNTATGYQSLYLDNTGSYNTALGSYADGIVNLVNITAIGYGAIVDGDDKVRIGNTDVTSIGGQVGWTTFSDGRYKKNIKENVKGLVFINSLKPITYTVDINGLNTYFDKNRKHDSAYEKMKKDMQPSADAASKIVYNGFIAQDVEAAAKKLDYEFNGVDKPQNKDGLYGLRYADFVVPLVKAVQELNDSLEQSNASLQAQINELKSIVEILANKSGIALPQTEAKISGARLEQNTPNPFAKTTYIKYYVPSTSKQAQVIITDINGKIIKQETIYTNGNGQINVDAGTLAAGNFTYSLYVDGKRIDTKHMMHLSK